MMRFTYSLCLLFCLLLAPLLEAQDSQYVLTDLGHADDLGSEANAISAGGVVVGSIIYNSSGTPRKREFHYADGIRHFDYDGGSSPNMKSEALAVNDSGCAVGWTQNADGAPIYIAVWKAADTCPFNDSVNLTGLGGLNSSGQGINNDNLMVGYSKTDTDEFHAFSMPVGATNMTDLGVLTGGWNSAPWDISDDDVTVGYSTSATTIRAATRWVGGTPIDLGAFPGSTVGTESYAFAINNALSPQIVGWSYGPQAVGQPHGFIWQDGAMEDLGTLVGGDWSEGYDVNDHGDVVGRARGSDFMMYAVLWEDNRIVDLNAVDGIPPGWVLSEARGINNAGQIVGVGFFDSTDRAFLLTPVLFSDGFEDGTSDGWSSAVP